MNPYESTTFEASQETAPKKAEALVVLSITGFMFAMSMMFFSTILRLELRASIAISITIALATVAYEIRGARTPSKSRGKKVILFVLLTFAVGVFTFVESARQKKLRQAVERIKRNSAERLREVEEKP